MSEPSGIVGEASFSCRTGSIQTGMPSLDGYETEATNPASEPVGEAVPRHEGETVWRAEAEQLAAHADALTARAVAAEAERDRLRDGLEKAVKNEETEWVDANIIQLLLDRSGSTEEPEA